MPSVILRLGWLLLFMGFPLTADDIIVTGILTAKWSPDLKDVRCDLEPILVANHVRY